MLSLTRSSILFGGPLILITLVLVRAHESSQLPTIQKNDQSQDHFVDLLISPIEAALQEARRLLNLRFDMANNQSDQSFMESQRRRARDLFMIEDIQTYESFKRQYNKTYAPEEASMRLKLFLERKNAIDESEREFAVGKSLFAMRLNEFIDWTKDELKKLSSVKLPTNWRSMASEGRQKRSVYDYGGYNAGENTIVRAEPIPASKDWRSTGCISTPYNQMECGSCYAFSTMTTVEAMRCIMHNASIYPKLSPQQVIDCASGHDYRSNGYINNGCNGGWPGSVLTYLQKERYAATIDCYPYINAQGGCRLREMVNRDFCWTFASPSSKETDNGLQYKELRNEVDMLHHVARVGPIIAVMDSTEKFVLYGKGIFENTECQNQFSNINHAIMIVGYGSENGIDYWIVKNSWGTTNWGENGYAKYRRGNNTCSIGHIAWGITQ